VADTSPLEHEIAVPNTSPLEHAIAMADTSHDIALADISLEHAIAVTDTPLKEISS
jgi:hypothetical protein